MEWKTCSRCKRKKLLTSFSPNKARADGVQGWCKTCDSEYHKAYYEKNKEKWRKKYRSKRAIAKNRNREYVYEVLSSSVCADCGIDDVRVLEFDHVRGEKLSNVSGLISNAVSIERLKDEIAKCEVVCANCHRIRTLTGSNSYRVVMGGYA